MKTYMATPQTVQREWYVVDAQGKTIRVDLKGAGQIEEMKTLVVRGVVAQGSDTNNLVVNAQGIYVEN